MHPLTPLQLAVWQIMRMKAGEIAAATYRSYKASLITALQTLAAEHPESSDAIEHLQQTHHTVKQRAILSRLGV